MYITVKMPSKKMEIPMKVRINKEEFITETSEVLNYWKEEFECIDNQVNSEHFDNKFLESIQNYNDFLIELEASQ